MAEFLDCPADLEAKLAQLSEWLAEAKNIVVFTGAGVSTAAGIPDFRGKDGLDAKPKPLVVLGAEEAQMDAIMPTYAHVAITALVQAGRVSFVATSNHDGLHYKAGTPVERVADVFGCVYRERCLSCGKSYLRHSVMPSLGRKCDKPDCAGRLRKTGTVYGQATPEEPLRRATEAAQAADLALVLGSSLTVSPFCRLPSLVPRRVIVTMQETAYDDDDGSLPIHARCDELLQFVMHELSVDVPRSLTYRQTLRVRAATDERGIWQLLLTTPYTNDPPGIVEDACVKWEGRDMPLAMNKKRDGDWVADLPEGLPAGLDVVVQVEALESFAEAAVSATVRLTADEEVVVDFDFVHEHALPAELYPAKARADE